MMPSERMPQADTSLTARPLQWLTHAVIRFPLATLLIAGVAVAVAIWLTMTQLGFRTSRAELLNPHSDYNRRWLEYTKEFGDKEDVVVVVEGERREQIVPALDEVCRGLAQQSESFRRGPAPDRRPQAPQQGPLLSQAGRACGRSTGS